MRAASGNIRVIRVGQILRLCLFEYFSLTVYSNGLLNGLLKPPIRTASLNEHLLEVAAAWVAGGVSAQEAKDKQADEEGDRKVDNDF